ncbi:DUF58 domain-containing protein [Rhizomonospora bruguierae]|uniref:DUF58 domain-containing protein n=1 Tax=Rhizomonospora bruguierae TaxID=1581705 RepID=UPI001BCAE0AF|nr:DUF58 domain-containing protein [Micromonospora sp. NBRC 107566]
MITRRAGLLLAAAAFTLPLWPWPWLGVALMAGLVIAFCLLDAALAAPLERITARREGARAVRLGERADVELRLHNGSERRLRAEVRDAWVPSAGAHPELHHVVAEPGGTVTLPATLTPTRRGDRPAVRLTIRSYGPFGFAYRQSRGRRALAATPPWTLRVLPRFESRRLLPEKLSRLRLIEGAVATRGRGQGTEFDSLREYVLGDDVRSIDWRASARRADVLVRTWRPERDRRVLCLVDTGRTAAVLAGAEPRLDVAMDAALLLATLASRAGDRVDLLAVDTAVRAAVSGANRRTLLPRLVNALAPLEPALVETDFELAVGEVLRRARKRALVVLFTALEPGALGEGLLPVLPRLAARHRVLLAAVHDPVLDDLTAGPARTADDVYASAAAWRAIAERDQVSAALRRGGVQVVDAPVGQFASRVADAYLALKTTGRL